MPRSFVVTKSFVVTLATLSIAATGFAGSAQANRWTCAMTLSKGGCPMFVHIPAPPKPRGK